MTLNYFQYIDILFWTCSIYNVIQTQIVKGIVLCNEFKYNFQLHVYYWPTNGVDEPYSYVLIKDVF